ncbi:MAG: TonB-dependent receptor [Altibacter sp.]|uniref:TonB-dependent receptor n=1 Tax=Altibacter sp. TaxID=2024823 RepID=UPI001D1AF8C3|nr:TonB-dependent receptor [Altibacter sp.]MBZ0328691.1 TonB-dependent receptor [Altibacter sp.]
MKQIHFLLLALIAVAEATSQNSISGHLTNQDNEPISATVYIPQLEKGTMATLDGYYAITNIPDGTYTIVYSLLGYATISKKFDFSDDKTLTEDLQLVETAVEMEEIIISTPFHKLQRDNVMKVERVGLKQLKANGAVTLADGISNIAGVETISTGVGIGKPVIRGLSANRVLTYTQGVRLENQQFGDEHGLGINEAGIESVEVIKGPASLLYGSDALGGVLYLNPERFAEVGKTKADIETTYYSNTRGTTTNFGFKNSSEKLKFLVRAAYVTHSDYKTGIDYRVTNSRFNESDIKTGLRYQATQVTSTLRYNYNQSNIGIPEEIGIQNTDKKLLLPNQTIDNHILSSENMIFFNNSSLNIKMGYLFNDRREFEESASPTLRLKLNTFNYDATYHLPVLGRFESIVGVQGMYQKNANFGEEVLIPNATTKDIGILGTTHYHLEKIDLQAGLRFDSRTIHSVATGDIEDQGYIDAISKKYTSFNLAVGAKIDFSERLLARLNFASGFRAPNLAELTSNGVHEGTNRYEIGNPNLENEQNFQTDLSIEYRNEHIELFANGFYNLVNQYIFISPTQEMIDENEVFKYVQQDAYLFGGEFGLHIHPHPLDWLHFESTFETVTGKLENDANLPLIPANSFTNTFRVEFNNSKFTKDSYAFASLKSTFKQQNTGAFETASEGYNLLNMGVGSSFQLNKVWLHIGLNAINLTDQSYIAHLSRLKLDGIPNMGRSFQLNLKLEI